MSERWLLLIHRLPPEPAYFRVKVRRRLERIGAVLLKNSVYALPWTDESIEDFQWVRREIVDGGGEAMLCAAEFLEGFDEETLRELRSPAAAERIGSPQAATWVTRRGVHIDRIASAWLIRRFIDPQARFKFVDAEGYVAAPGELRFDMYAGEFTHEADRCTFETLLLRFGLRDPGLVAIGEIVHDIDCKDGKFGRSEAAGLAELVRGVTLGNGDDGARLDAGAALLESLHRSLATRLRAPAEVSERDE